MTWAGTGLLWHFTGGTARSQVVEGAELPATEGLQFVQISDSHIGFNKLANPNVTATLEAAVAKINALEERPAFLIHTGDISHLSKPEEFDSASEILSRAKCGEQFWVPGEHDVIQAHGKPYLERFGKNTRGDGWFSFDLKGVHFIGLVNVLDFHGGLGALGKEQLEWLRENVRDRGSSTPIVVFAHIPLWTVHAEWGWGTEDGAQALSYLRRFGSVTVLNGHIHQTMQKVEGNLTFHTAASTAFPQPTPGGAPAPGPMMVPAGQLRSYLGLTSVRYRKGTQSLAVVDTTLE